MRVIKLILALGMLALIAVFLWLLTPLPPQINQELIRTTAQSYDSRILRDPWGAAHIFGRTDPDASFGLGYSHAEDDWVTIEEAVIASRGQMAQYLGRDSAPTDYLFDLFKVQEAVDKKIDTDIRADTRAMVKAYADGLNLWAIENKGKVQPGILPITDKDILAGISWNTPFFYRMDDTIKSLFSADEKPSVSPWQKQTRLNLPPAVRGSNAFAVAPSRSDDGHTRLIVNSHQPFTGRYAWFEAHMVSEEGLNLVGGGFPGTPVLPQGVTPHLGWGHTVNRPDLVDIYALKTDRETKPRRYWMDGQWHEFDKTLSKFRVKLWGPLSLPITRTVLWSEHGPVLSTPTGHYAIRFSGLQDIRAIQQWYDMSKAQNLEEWQAAIAQNGVLSFNIVYADKDGHIGEIYNARMPHRIEGVDWTDILPGDTSALIWKSFRPLSDMPHHYDPPSGWLFSANATPFRITDRDYDNQREDYSSTFGIERRITNRSMQALAQIEPDQAVSAEELILYRANGDYHPAASLPQMVRHLVNRKSELSESLHPALEILADWDRGTDIDNRATALAVLTGMKALGGEFEETLMAPDEALAITIDELMSVYGRIDPMWGEVNRLRRGEVDLALDGGPDTLRAIYGDRENFVKNKGLVAFAGDTHIMVADWDEDGQLSLQTIHQFGAATQDQNSPHYADQAPLFARGEYKAMPVSLEAIEAVAIRDYRPGK